jgi:hypothetical protein
MGLRALSQRAMVSVYDWFMLISVVMVWWAWISIPDPNVHQIVALSILSGFALVANFIVRKVR